MLGMFIAACSHDATAPRPLPSAAAVARRLDSLYAEALAEQNTEGYDVLRFAELGPAFGATPVAVSVTYNGKPQSWIAFGADLVGQDTLGNRTDIYFVVASPDASFNTMVVAEQSDGFPPPPDLTTGYLSVGGGNALPWPGSGPVTASTKQLGGACNLIPGLVGSNVTKYSGDPCQLMQIQATMALRFAVFDSTDSVSMQVTVNGVSLTIGQDEVNSGERTTWPTESCRLNYRVRYTRRRSGIRAGLPRCAAGG